MLLIEPGTQKDCLESLISHLLKSQPNYTCCQLWLQSFKREVGSAESNKREVQTMPKQKNMLSSVERENAIFWWSGSNKDTFLNPCTCWKWAQILGKYLRSWLLLSPHESFGCTQYKTTLKITAHSTLNNFAFWVICMCKLCCNVTLYLKSAYLISSKILELRAVGTEINVKTVVKYSF